MRSSELSSGPRPHLSLGAASSAPGRTEQLRRRLYLGVAALAGIGQVVVALSDLGHGRTVQGASVFGILVCAAVLAVLLWRRLPLKVIDYGVLAVSSAGVAVQLAFAFRDGVSEARLYFVGLFLFVTAFSTLPSRFAALYAVVLYALFAALTFLLQGDVTLLAEQGLIVLLVAHLTFFGQRVSADRAEATLYQMLALTDTLTGLLNRRAMYEVLGAAFQRRETIPPPLVLLLLDIDHFKRVNDEHGHAVGDEVLQAFSVVLQRACHPETQVSRWGGEEFLLLLPALTDREVLDCAERVLSEVRALELSAGLRVTASCGVASAGEAQSVSEWLALADQRLYAAKSAGRDQFRAVG